MPTKFATPSRPSSNTSSMTLVSDDPSWWPFINASRIASYFVVVASAGVVYDWALAFGQEVELVWRQRWSLMTVLYLIVRYLGIIYAVISILVYGSTITVTDVGCYVMYVALNCITLVAHTTVGVIMMVRLHAMYLRRRKMLILLVVVFLPITIADGVIAGIILRRMSVEELILSGTYQCTVEIDGDSLYFDLGWILNIVWEVLVLCLAILIAVKHFRELRQQSAGGIVGDCFTVLMKTHVIYFASVAAVSCLNLGYLSPMISRHLNILDNQIYLGVLPLFEDIQIFVLGPRLILSIREYSAELMADSDTGTSMSSIAFQERAHVSTSSSV